MTAYVARLRVYPVKSLDGADVASASFTARGGLRDDRALALYDAAGTPLNGKREPAVHAIRATYGPEFERGTFSTGAVPPATIALADTRALAAWMTLALARQVTVRRDDAGGFPDDVEAPGPTIVSTATLEAVAAWFPGVGVESMRRRVRANVEIDGVEAFWEDRLNGAAGEPLPFRIGGVVIAGTNPCQRCVVPARDPDTGVPLDGFAKRLAERREATLPPWANRARFNHFYRLAVNTRVSDGARAGTIRIGDVVGMRR